MEGVGNFPFREPHRAIRGVRLPNLLQELGKACMELGSVDLLVDALTVGVTPSGAAEELQIRWGFLFAWSIGARQEMHMRLPNTNSTTSTRRIILKPRCTCSNISCWQEKVSFGVRVDACEPMAMASIIVFNGHAEPTSAGQPSSAYSLSSGDAG